MPRTILFSKKYKNQIVRTLLKKIKKRLMNSFVEMQT